MYNWLQNEKEHGWEMEGKHGGHGFLFEVNFYRLELLDIYEKGEESCE